ncbi:hypothetical protein [Patulibacter minatonensis]|uniref:hypothetical protein n=1 Tax=Patulibacter minatonensis TaxID=298163 RepID=UPI00047E776D|nr:hypothetical protein [Patulibacter minatonensis]
MTTFAALLVLLIGLALLGGAGELGTWYRRHRIPGEVITPYVRFSQAVGVALIAIGALGLAGAGL